MRTVCCGIYGNGQSRQTVEVALQGCAHGSRDKHVIAQIWPAVYPGDDPWPDKDAPDILRELCEGTVCEIGCGTGRVAALFKAKQYIGFDISELSLEVARKALPDHDFRLLKVGDNVVVGGGVQIPTISGLNGFGANAEVRVYPNGKNLRGFYIAPNISFNHLSSEDGSTSPFSFGVLVGWQWFPGDQFALGFGLGADYYIGTITENNGDFENYSGFVPALRFDIGYAW